MQTLKAGTVLMPLPFLSTNLDFHLGIPCSCRAQTGEAEGAGLAEQPKLIRSMPTLAKDKHVTRFRQMRWGNLLRMMGSSKRDPGRNYFSLYVFHPLNGDKEIQSPRDAKGYQQVCGGGSYTIKLPTGSRAKK